GPVAGRREPTDFWVSPESDLDRQYEVIARLDGSGVPVPRLRGLERDPGVIGSAFYVMDAVDGEVPSEVPSYHLFGWVHDASPAPPPTICPHGLPCLAP